MMIKLITVLFGLGVDMFVDTIRWLRRPGSSLKVVCGVLAIVALVVGLHSYTRGIQVAELQNRIVVIQTEYEATTAELQSDVEARDASLAKVAEILRAEAAKLEEMQAEAAIAADEMDERLEEAERQGDDWRERYADRPMDCAAALEVLDTACPVLKGY